MAKYRKKPVIIEAERWNPPGPDGIPKLTKDIPHPDVRPTSYAEVARHLGTSGCSHASPHWSWGVMGVIETLEGPLFIVPGDWIITGIAGEKYPCKPDIFEATYEPAPG